MKDKIDIPCKCCKNEKNPKINPTKNEILGFSISEITIIGICIVVILIGPKGINPIGDNDKIIIKALNNPILDISLIEIFFMKTLLLDVYLKINLISKSFYK